MTLHAVLESVTLITLTVGVVACSAPETGREVADATATVATFQIRRDVFADFPVTLVGPQGAPLLGDEGPSSLDDALTRIDRQRELGTDPGSYTVGVRHDGWFVMVHNPADFAAGSLTREGLDSEAGAFDLMNQSLEAFTAGPVQVRDLTDLCGLSLVADGDGEQIALFDDGEHDAAQLMGAPKTHSLEDALVQVDRLVRLGQDPEAWRVTDHGFALVDEEGEVAMKNTFHEFSSFDRDRRLSLAQAAFKAAGDCTLFVGM